MMLNEEPTLLPSPRSTWITVWSWPMVRAMGKEVRETDVRSRSEIYVSERSGN
jgi:hypothetical protein